MLASLRTLFRDNWLSRNLALVMVFAAIAAGISTFIVISGASSPMGIKPKRVISFLSVDIALLVILVTIIAKRIYSLWSALRAGSTGSQLQKRILVLFSIVTITPTLIVSVFAFLFFNLGIQTWFNDRVQTAVNESLVVAEAYLAEHKENIRADAIAMANDLSQVSNIALSDPVEFNRIVSTQSALRLLTESLVFQGDRILAEGPLSYALAFEHVPQDLLDRAAKGEVVLMATDSDKVRALVKIENLENTYLLVGRLIDDRVLMHMQHTQGAVNEYNTLKSHLDTLETTFEVVFVVLTLLLLLTSIWYGMAFAARLTKPISGLVFAAERVRGGDFSARVSDSQQKDELATLSRTFNRMTEQLEAQRADLIFANRSLDERRRFSEAVLAGVSAGVIALDQNKNITLFSRSAISILGKIDLAITPEAKIDDILPGIQEALHHAEDLPGEIAQSTLMLNNNGKTLTLHMRVSVEQLDEQIEGFIVTFDDISLLVAAQRNAAWADVARRVAHEIKNPLTPIQLAAERLKRKYLKYITEDQDTFIKYTDTIVRHVGDIGKMVEEFVSFARMPQPKFASEDVSALVKKSIFSAQVANPGIDYVQHIPDQETIMNCDERQITQVMTNLLKNAAESIETRQSREEIPEKGRIVVQLTCRDDKIVLTVEDNGTGFPGSDMQKMLEPYVTTRTKGTGLGLSIVKKIVDDHKGLLNIENIPDGGARVTLSFLQHCDINAAS